jgi:hypothetical protein
MYGNLGGIAVGAGVLATTGSTLSAMFIVVAVTAVAIGALVLVRERASRRTAQRAGGQAE